MSNYKDGVGGSDLCHMEGCVGNGRCPRCGDINYALMGYYGAVARWAKGWGVSTEEAETRISVSQHAAWLRSAEGREWVRHDAIAR